MINVAMLSLLAVTALAAIRSHDLFATAVLFGIYSFLTAVLFMNLQAVDVAFTEAAVGAGISTVLMLSTLSMTGRHESRSQRKPLVPLLVVSITGAALVHGVLDVPRFGDAQAPAHAHVARRYIEQGMAETGVPNMVTSVLASYRGYDTLGEAMVIFTAALAVILLLGLRPEGAAREGHQAIGDLMVLRVVGKVLIAFILLFALYVQFHGDYGAGGGFQAGVIFATGFVIYDLLFGAVDARRVMPPIVLERLAAAGVLLYGGVGVASLLLGRNFLDYFALASDPVEAQHLGIFLVELGIGITVFAAVLLIFNAFSGFRLTPTGEPRHV